MYYYLQLYCVVDPFPEKALHLLDTMGCASNYFKDMEHATRSTYIAMLLKSDETSLVLGGDGRADSPGHSAKHELYIYYPIVILKFSCDDVRSSAGYP